MLPLPHSAVLRTVVAAGSDAPVRFRFGVSDDHTYDALSEITIQAHDGRRHVDLDLSGYAGMKWSLFYRPDRVAWHLVFGADPVHGPAVALWELPQIFTTRQGAREYMERRTRMESRQ